MKQNKIIQAALVIGGIALFALPLATPALAKKDFSYQMVQLNETYTRTPQYMNLSASRPFTSAVTNDSKEQVLTEAQKKRHLDTLYEELAVKFQLTDFEILEPEFNIITEGGIAYLKLAGTTKNSREEIYAEFELPVSAESVPVLENFSIKGFHDQNKITPFIEQASALFESQLKHPLPKDGEFDFGLSSGNFFEGYLYMRWMNATETYEAAFCNIDLDKGVGTTVQLTIYEKESFIDTTGPDFHPDWFTNAEKEKLVHTAKEFVKTTGICAKPGEPVGVERRNMLDVNGKPVMVILFKDSEAGRLLRVHVGRDTAVWGYEWNDATHYTGSHGMVALTKEELQPFLKLAEKAVTEKLTLKLPEGAEFTSVHPWVDTINLNVGSAATDYWCSVNIENYNVEKGTGEVTFIEIFSYADDAMFAPFFNLGKAELEKQLDLKVPAHYKPSDIISIGFKNNELFLNVAWTEPEPANPFSAQSYVAHFNSVDLNKKIGTFRHLGINASQLQLITEHPFAPQQVEQMQQTAMNFAAKENFATGDLIETKYFEFDEMKGLTFIFENGLSPRLNSAISIDENGTVVEYNWLKIISYCVNIFLRQ